MTPESFVAKWSKSELKERSACQEHFLDLCQLVGHPTPEGLVPSHSLIVFATNQEAVFGLLHSRIHEVWALAMGSFIGVGNDARYTPNTTFETFPFPPGWQVAGKGQVNTDEHR